MINIGCAQHGPLIMSGPVIKCASAHSGHVIESGPAHIELVI